MPQAEVVSDATELYPLQPKQEDFMYCDAKYQVFGGAKGGGKSYACRAKSVKACMSVSGLRGIAFRRTMPEIEENMVNPMLDELPEDVAEYNGSKHILHFANGSTLRFAYCENMKHVRRYQGIQYDFVCIEELTQWREDEWRVLMNCLRTTRKGVRPIFFGSTNPGDVGHGWVKRLFIDKKYRANENPNDYAMIRSKLWDNKVLVDNDPDYVQNLQNLPEKLRRAYLDGDWNVFEGQYFEEYREEVTTCVPFTVIGVKRRIIAIDYGRAKPACALWMALLNDGRVIVYRELYGTGMGYDQFAAKIKALMPESENVDFMVCDPAALNKESDDGSAHTLNKAFINAKLPKCKEAINTRIDGWNTVRTYLRPYQDPESKRLTSMLTIFTNCDNLIRTIPEQIHDTIVVEDLDTHGEDHAVDALRYGLMALSVNMSSLSDVSKLNQMLEKNVIYDTMTPKEREMKRRGISDRHSGSILDTRF